MTAPKKKTTPSRRHAGGRPAKPEGERLEAQIAIRTDPALSQRLDALARRVGPAVSRPAIARAALAFGLEVLEKDPTMMFFKDEREQAEHIIRKYWGADGAFGEAEREGDEFMVSLGLFDGAKVTGAGIEGVKEARSQASFRDALNVLADRYPPKRRLPWR